MRLCQEKLKVEVVGMKVSIVVVLFVGYLLIVLGAKSFAAEPTKVLIAHGAISNNVEPLWIAKEQGIFHKYGIEADLVFIIAGRAMQAMLAGQVPIGMVGATHVVNANTGGGDFVMILGLQNSLDYLFISRPNIKSAEELKGKKVAIGTPSGSASLATYVALDYLGLNPRRDNIVLLGIGGVPERLRIFARGQRRGHELVPRVRPDRCQRGVSCVAEYDEGERALSVRRGHGRGARYAEIESAAGRKCRQGND